MRARALVERPATVAGFSTVTDAPPENPLLVPDAPVAPPPASSAVVYDIFGNHWCLGAASTSGCRRLLVLPAQQPDHWTPDTLSKLPVHAWRFLAADEFGYLWVASSSRCMRLDPHTPEIGWLDLTAELLGAAASKATRITALGIAASGAAIFALESGSTSGSGSLASGSGFLVEIDRTDHTIVQRSPAPGGIERIACDGEGNLWLQCKQTAYRRLAAAGAWQRRWRLVDRIPAGDHDLSGDVMDGVFYMGGGQNAGWGYPARPHVFRELMAFDPSVQHWSTVALLDQPRFYNGTSWLDGRVWIIGGNTRDAQYNSVTLSSVEIWNPRSKTLGAGPELPVPLDNPVALHIGGRIYCAGFRRSDLEAEPCLLFSIGKDETSWRREPDGPSYKYALAATAYQDSLYFAIPDKGLGCFDTKSSTWKLIPFAHPVRSPQMASYHDQIWIMGGRDIDHQDQTILYKPSDGSWSSGPSLPRELAWGAGTVVGGQLMVVGGAAGRGYNNRTFYLRKQPIS